jgi:hypothetical protein
MSKHDESGDSEEETHYTQGDAHHTLKGWWKTNVYGVCQREKKEINKGDAEHFPHVTSPGEAQRVAAEQASKYFRARGGVS